MRYLIILGLSIILFGYNRYRKSDTYSNKEMEKVLNFLAFNLLLSRDKMYSSTSPSSDNDHDVASATSPTSTEVSINQKTNSIIESLQIELSQRGQIQRFYQSKPRITLPPPNNNNSNNKDEYAMINANLNKTVIGDIETSLLNSSSLDENISPRNSASLMDKNTNNITNNNNNNHKKCNFSCLSNTVNGEVVVNPFVPPPSKNIYPSE